MPENSPAQLVRRAADGDQSAWHELVARYSSLVWSVAREHRLPACDAADVYQATWLNLAQYLGRLRDPERLAGWLATTARRESLRVLAVRRREAPLDWADIRTAGAGPEEEVLATDRDGVLWQAFDALSEQCRTLLRLIAHAPELSYAQAASALGVRIGSVGPIRGRCLAALRRRLEIAGLLEGVAR